MERINCGLLSNYIGHCTLIQSPNQNVTKSFNPLQHSGMLDFGNPKANCTYKSGHNGGEITGKKGIHKLVERKRRKDMKILFSLIRSLLPEEYIRGKRSTAEQLSETAEYIKHLQRTVQELTQKREEMRKKKCCQDLSLSVASETFPIVKINYVGSVVLVSTSTIKHDIVLSDLLLTLENNGLDIFSVTSFAMHEKVFHTIHAEVSDLQRFESRSLHQKVWNL
ncbi:hypothetical protein KI387_019424, partial [Taxus chinensis]